MNDGDQMTAEMLDLKGARPNMNAAQIGKRSALANPAALIEVNLEQEFWEIERDILEAAIRYSKNSIPKASDMLGLSPSTIYRKRESWEKMEQD